MSKHRLLIFDRISRRMRWRLVLLLIAMLLLGIYDQFTGYLGSFWLAWWLAIILVAALYIYYAVLIPRASIQVGPGSLRLQGPLTGYNFSYGRIYSVASGNMEQHYSKKQLGPYEWSIIKPLYFSTCLFIEFNSTPRHFDRRRLWFPRILFGSNRPGLICYVEDWMALSQEIDLARSKRRNALEQPHISNRKTLVGQILDENIEFK